MLPTSPLFYPSSNCWLTGYPEELLKMVTGWLRVLQSTEPASNQSVRWSYSSRNGYPEGGVREGSRSRWDPSLGPRQRGFCSELWSSSRGLPSSLRWQRAEEDGKLRFHWENRSFHRAKGAAVGAVAEGVCPGIYRSSRGSWDPYLSTQPPRPTSRMPFCPSVLMTFAGGG